MKRWLVCQDCNAGPFIPLGNNNMCHWYDKGHLNYRVVDAPADGIEGDWKVEFAAAPGYPTGGLD